jgi:hypothetical protein
MMTRTAAPYTLTLCRAKHPTGKVLTRTGEWWTEVDERWLWIMRRFSVVWP